MSLILDDDELLKLTGYRKASRQLAVLHGLGFWRARRAPITGRVVLERAHYEAVCAGDAARPAKGRRGFEPEPQLSPA